LYCSHSSKQGYMQAIAFVHLGKGHIDAKLGVLVGGLCILRTERKRTASMEQAHLAPEAARPPHSVEIRLRVRYKLKVASPTRMEHLQKPSIG